MTWGNTFPRDPLLQKFLWGRKLLYEECSAFDQNIIENHILHQFIYEDPGITFYEGRPCCGRCGNTDPEKFGAYLCHRCGKQCHYCRACITMGVVKECSSLLTWTGSPPVLEKSEQIAIRWDGELSIPQKKASNALVNALHHKNDFLIWAVCGAGKTELLYPAIQNALLSGLRVGIVSPRTDVIIELTDRLKPIFSDVPIVALYGDSPDEYEDVPLLLSTTHQLLRFDHRFDVFFIDEVDAFPFHNNSQLETALDQAGTEKALHFYLTATPTEKMIRLMQTGALQGVKIPVRFHGHPLPEPRFRWIGSWRKQIVRGNAPPILKRWIGQRLTNHRPGFIFVPTIEMVERLVPLLKKIHPSIEGVHSEDPDRHEKMIAFRSGDIPILVTTTILERGVTIPFVEVAVLGADEPIFDEKALVQISGRVGRDARDPKGDIVFFHGGLTLAILKALRHIRQMNREGGK